MADIAAIIRQLWDAQGYGNIAVYADGTSRQVPAGYEPAAGEEQPVTILKPMVLVGIYPMLDHALGDPALADKIKALISGQTP